MNKNIWKKLLEIQKAIPAFLNTEKAEKKKPNSKESEYLYTPGAVISQAIRGEMDKRGIMMVMSVVEEQHQMIEYPVYKMINNQVVAFNKKENLSVITVEYTWIDTESGETVGPYRMIASGANGTDKSTASALSTAERYIFLKFFHIPCKDHGIEIDAHDSSFIPGLKDQPACANNAQIAAQKNAAPVQQVIPATTVQVSSNPRRPMYGPEYEESVNAVSMFGKGTPSHTEAVNRELGKLAALGYPANDKSFIDTFVNIADERRLKNIK